MSRPAFPAEAYLNGHIRVRAYLVDPSSATWVEEFRLPINFTEEGERGVLVDWSREGIFDHLERHLAGRPDVHLDGIDVRARVDHQRPELSFDLDQSMSSLNHLDLF